MENQFHIHQLNQIRIFSPAYGGRKNKVTISGNVASSPLRMEHQ